MIGGKFVIKELEKTSVSFGKVQIFEKLVRHENGVHCLRLTSITP